MNISEMTYEVIRDFCVRGIPFTSLDISNAVKVSFHDVVISHSDVAAQVRKVLTEEFLTRAKMGSKEVMVSLSSGAKFKTTLYYNLAAGFDSYNCNGLKVIPVKTDPQPVVSAPVKKEYTAVSIQVKKEKSEQPKTKPIAQAIQELRDKLMEKTVCKVEPKKEEAKKEENKISRSEVKEVTAEGRLEIPFDIIEAIDFDDEGRCFFVKNTDNSFIVSTNSKYTDAKNLVFTSYADKYGRIRVPKTVFVKCGLPHTRGDKYTVTVNNKNTIVVSAE